MPPSGDHDEIFEVTGNAMIMDEEEEHGTTEVGK